MLHRCRTQPAYGRPERRGLLHAESQAGGTRSASSCSPVSPDCGIPPTTDTETLIEAINNVTTARGTAIGSAILTSIDGIAAIDPTARHRPVSIRNRPSGRVTRHT